MAFYRAAIGGGSTETETTLWTNPNPTSSFTQTTVSLSQAYTNFRKIRIYYKIVNTDTSGAESFVEYYTSNVQNWGVQGGSSGTSPGEFGGCISCRRNTTSSSRLIYRSSDSSTSKLAFLNSTTAAGGSSSGTNIPTKITGVN